MSTEENNTQLPQSSVSKSVIATELRLGNKVLARCYDDKTYFEETIVTGIFEDEIHHESVGMTHPVWENEIINIKPIQITEERLLKIGFENGVDEMTLCTDKICVYWRKFEGHFEINGEKYFIEDFHIFQNLFFFLSGSELTVC